jgi:hypothetical protein
LRFHISQSHQELADQPVRTGFSAQMLRFG